MSACNKETHLRQAADPEAPPLALQRLARWREPVIDRLLAGNPRSPQQLLKQLALCWPVEFLNNPIVLLWALEGREIGIDIDLVEAAARFREAMEASGPKAAAEVVDHEDRCRLASMPVEAAALVPLLARDPDAFVRSQLLRRLGLATEENRFPTAYWQLLAATLDAAVEDPHEEVRSQLPKIRGLGERRLLRLAEDPSVMVQRSLANIPSEWDAEAAQMRLVERAGRSVLLYLCANARLGKAVAVRLAERGPEIQLQLTRANQLNVDVALVLACRGSLTVRRELAVRDWQRAPSVYEALAGRHYEVDQLLLRNLQLCGHAVGTALERVKPQDRIKLCGFAQISQLVIAALAHDPEPEVRQTLAQRMRSPGHHLPTPIAVAACNQLALSAEPEVRHLLLADRRLNAQTLRLLAAEAGPDELLQLAANPSLPYELAFALFDHPCEAVARAGMASAGRLCAELLLRFGRTGHRGDLLGYVLLCRRFLAAAHVLDPARWAWLAQERGTPDRVLGWLAGQGDAQLHEVLASQRPFTFIGRLLETSEGRVRWVRWKELSGKHWAREQGSSPNLYQRGCYARYCPRGGEFAAMLGKDPHPFVQRMLRSNPRLCS